jgi:hypothetical protein
MEVVPQTGPPHFHASLFHPRWCGRARTHAVLLALGMGSILSRKEPSDKPGTVHCSVCARSAAAKPATAAHRRQPVSPTMHATGCSRTLKGGHGCSPRADPATSRTAAARREREPWRRPSSALAGGAALAVKRASMKDRRGPHRATASAHRLSVVRYGAAPERTASARGQVDIGTYVKRRRTKTRCPAFTTTARGRGTCPPSVP